MDTHDAKNITVRLAAITDRFEERGEQVVQQCGEGTQRLYQAAQQVITQCLQIHGGLGYMDDHWTSRFYRDARALTIAAGTPEVMREMIAAYMRV